VCCFLFLAEQIANVLREHLKRKHYPVQCERCYRLFDGGSDRAVKVRELENHRKLPQGCELGDASLKEGISEAQWASLDRKKKNQGSSNIEKWNEIWAILFPDKPCPETPCKHAFHVYHNDKSNSYRVR
jgi:hypothetical protein